MAKTVYPVRLEDATIEELEGIAAARKVSVSQVLRDAIDQALANQGDVESLSLEQLNAARTRIDRMIADAEERLIAEIRANEVPPDLVLVELKRGVWIKTPRAEAVERGLKFREVKSSSK